MPMSDYYKQLRKKVGTDLILNPGVCRVDGGTLQAIDGESAELRYYPPTARPPLALPYPEAVFLGGNSAASNLKPNS